MTYSRRLGWVPTLSQQLLLHSTQLGTMSNTKDQEIKDLEQLCRDEYFKLLVVLRMSMRHLEAITQSDEEWESRQMFLNDEREMRKLHIQ